MVNTLGKGITEWWHHQQKVNVILWRNGWHWQFGLHYKFWLRHMIHCWVSCPTTTKEKQKVGGSRILTFWWPAPGHICQSLQMAGYNPSYLPGWRIQTALPSPVLKGKMRTGPLDLCSWIQKASVTLGILVLDQGSRETCSLSRIKVSWIAQVCKGLAPPPSKSLPEFW